MSSSSKHVLRSVKKPWPNFALLWKVRLDAYDRRRLCEHIAGLGMIQENQRRALEGKPPFVLGTIIAPLHDSPSDRKVHVTIAAATQDMKDRGIYYDLHSRIKAWDDETFAGSQAFEAGFKKVDAELANAHKKSIRIHSSLVSDDPDTTLVGCTVVNEVPRWYVVNGDGPVVFLEEDKFFRAGHESGEHLRFWDPIKERICRAEFNGIDRPRPYSPPPNASYNLESAMGGLDMGSEEEDFPPDQKPPQEGQEEEGVAYAVEWLAGTPQAKLGSRHPVRFKARSGETIKSHWVNWQLGQRRLDEDPDDAPLREYFWLSHEKKRIDFCSWQLPAMWVDTWLDESGKSPSAPYCFHTVSREIVRTGEHNWIPCGQNSQPFLAIECKGTAYLTMGLPTSAETSNPEQETKDRPNNKPKKDKKGKGKGKA